MPPLLCIVERDHRSDATTTGGRLAHAFGSLKGKRRKLSEKFVELGVDDPWGVPFIGSVQPTSGQEQNQTD
jgi:hypothetical protein